MPRPRLRAALLLGLALVALGLSVPPGTAAAGSATARASHPPVNPRTGLPAGYLPTRSQAQRAAASGPTATSSVVSLTYRGGPLVTNPEVEAVMWGSGTYVGGIDANTTMDDYFAHLGTSSYVAWLDEYRAAPLNQPTQHLDYGRFLHHDTITPANSTSSVTDAMIQTELVNDINSNALPHPTAGNVAGYSDTVYAIFFPDGKTICDSGGACSGVTFCAYHGTTSATVDGMHVAYLVLPDAHAMGSGCGNGTDLQNEESYTSHELIETITDPAVGLVTTLPDSRLGWYDDNNGEIADICNGQQSLLDSTYTVQKEWSNAASSCLTARPALAPSAVTNVAAAPAAGGAIAVSWSAPASSGSGGTVTEYDVYESTTPGVLGRTAVRVPATSTTWTTGAEAPGQHYFTVVARNDLLVAGPVSSQVSAIPDGTAPVVALSSPATLFQLSGTVRVAYHATDTGSGVADYDVQERTASWNSGFTGYASLASGTTATSRNVAGSPGHEYCFRVRARDQVGNVSAWSPDRCTVVPLDDRALSTATSGWRRVTASSAYRGTVTLTKTKGAKLKLAGASADRLALVVQTCAACGKVAIYLNGALWRTVNTASAATHAQVIMLPGTFGLRTATIVLKSTSTKKVVVDGLGVART